jgi:hypothetical protein
MSDHCNTLVDCTNKYYQDTEMRGSYAHPFFVKYCHSPDFIILQSCLNTLSCQQRMQSNIKISLHWQKHDAGDIEPFPLWVIGVGCPVVDYLTEYNSLEQVLKKSVNKDWFRKFDADLGSSQLHDKRDRWEDEVKAIRSAPTGRACSWFGCKQPELKSNQQQ